MKTRWAFVSTCCAVGSFVAVAHAAPRFALVPISATGTNTINGNEIRLTGTPQRVRLELKLSGWGTEQLRGWQARLACASYSNGVGGALTPAVVACPNSAFCATSVYERGSVCSGGNCTAGYINRERSDWVFLGFEPNVEAGVGLSSCDYLYFSTINADPPFLADPGAPVYGGGFALDVPVNAAGTYEVMLFETTAESFMINEFNQTIPPSPDPALAFGRARIVIVCETAANCNDSNACTTDACNNGVCTNAPNFDPAFCCNPANGNLTQISDGLDCTEDICNANGSVSHPNKPALTPCGNPTNSECNKPDSCDGAGNCNPRNEPITTNCGDPTNTTCNPADKCNGTGSCNANIATAGTPCGNINPLDPQCDQGDTCNGLGACLNNQVANGTPCDDGDFCTDPNLNERCVNGTCQPGGARDCADSFTCTTDSCNEATDFCDHPLQAGQCLIDEDGPGGAPAVCYAHGALNPQNTCEICDSSANPTDWTVLADGSACNDGNACTGTGNPDIDPDTCTGGDCEGELDPNCNDTCDVAVEAVVGQNVSDNSATGPDDGEASCEANSNADVWWAYTPSLCDGAVFISTTGSALVPVNDTVLSVYSDCPGLGGTEIACDDDSGVGLNAALIFDTSLCGSRCLIRLAGYGANEGPVVLNLRPLGSCSIAGVCYAEGEPNPENDCQACISDVSSTEWTNRLEGSSCDADGPGPNDGAATTDCDNPDACDGAGNCELNYKTDGIACSDDAPPHNECTKDLCLAGLCTHPPEPAGVACDFPGEGVPDCDNPDTCTGGGECAENLEAAGFPCGDTNEYECDNPDICNATGGCLENLKPAGTPCDDEDVCTGTDVCFAVSPHGTCAGTSILQAPAVTAISGRHLVVAPQPPGSPAPVALLVTSPDYPCLNQYIDLNGMLVPAAFKVTQLNDEWGVIIVQDPDIVPSTDYEVRAECGSFLSAPGTDQTYLWGDVEGDGDLDVLDVSSITDRLKELPVPYPDEAYDLFPCTPDGWINVIDLSRVVDALKGFPYPCGLPCHD